MSTWIEDFLKTVNSMDLSLPCPTQKKLDEDETVLGELNEYLQKLYRLRENYREIAEGFRDKIDDIKEVYDTEHRLGISTPKNCAEHMRKIRDIFEKFKLRFQEYVTVDHFFTKELENIFSLELVEFPVTGIRGGKTLIGRADNSRSDQDVLDKFFLQVMIILEFEKTLNKGG